MTFTPTDYNPYDFANRRHIGPSPSEMAEMLAAVGVRTLDELIDQTVPPRSASRSRCPGHRLPSMSFWRR
jgi:glycine cleavage system pyridoxal-binding protein P